MQMSFGKYKFEEVKDVPHSYLIWVIENVSFDHWGNDLKMEIIEVLKRGGYHYKQKQGQQQQDQAKKQKKKKNKYGGEKKEIAHPGVIKWRELWREIIFIAHPDRGGNESLCKLLVAVNEEMKKEPSRGIA